MSTFNDNLCDIFTGLSILLDGNRVTELALLYQLFSKVVGGLATLLQFWRGYIKVCASLPSAVNTHTHTHIVPLTF